MVSNIKKLAQLRALARLRQDIELAKLARLTAEDQRIADQQSDLRRAAHAVRHEAPLSALEARLQDRFGDWTERRLDRLQANRSALQPVIAAQKDQAARAVGREDVLGRLGDQLAQDLRLTQHRRS
ncbi:MAG: hypothetical protein IE922_00750 [Sphingomonadales bacterium]|nr:hypothetical protein [Sphingomonadales bacterium]